MYSQILKHQNQRMLILGAYLSHKTELIRLIFPDAQILDMRSYKRGILIDEQALIKDITDNQDKRIFIDEYQIAPGIGQYLTDKTNCSFIGQIPPLKAPSWFNSYELIISSLYSLKDLELFNYNPDLVKIIQACDNWPGIIKVASNNQIDINNLLASLKLIMDKDIRHFKPYLTHMIAFFSNKNNTGIPLNVNIKISPNFNYYQLPVKLRIMISGGILWIDQDQHCLKIPLPIKILLKKYFNDFII